MVWITTNSTVYLWLYDRTNHYMVYSFWLTASVFLYAPSHRQDGTYYTSQWALAGTRNKLVGRSDDPLHHKQSTTDNLLGVYHRTEFFLRLWESVECIIKQNISLLPSSLTVWNQWCEIQSKAFSLFKKTPTNKIHQNWIHTVIFLNILESATHKPLALLVNMTHNHIG